MKKLLVILLTLIFFSTAGKSQETIEGKIFKLKVGELLIPSESVLNSEHIKIFIHLHGKGEVVQKAFVDSKINGILITIHLGMFSSPYRIAFSDSTLLDSIIHEAINLISTNFNKKLDYEKIRIVFTSFSAGYGGIREILKSERYYSKIDAIILLDGLHTDYVETENGKAVNPQQMKDFLRFARDAVKFKREFIITHSEIIPEGYSSTTETANYLIDSTKTERIFAERLFDDGFVQKYYAFNGNFRIFGFYGNQAQDHLKHFYNIDKFLRMIDF
jgi:hypothetical protein